MEKRLLSEGEGKKQYGKERVDGFGGGGGGEEREKEGIRSLGEEERRRCGWRFPVAVWVILVILVIFSGQFNTINTRLQGAEYTQYRMRPCLEIARTWLVFNGKLC
jgi:hypothetical protein